MRDLSTLGLNELMIVNPSPKGAAHMEYYGPTGAYPDNGMGWGHGGPGLGDNGPMYVSPEPLGAMGYYGDPVADEAMGHFCPTCGSQHLGYTGAPEAYEEEDLGTYADDDLGVADYGEVDDYDEMGDVGYYGPYRDPPLGYGDGVGYPPMGGYAADARPSFNPEGQFSTLSGFERERSVNPTGELKATPAGAPTSHVPDIFKPYV